MGAKYYTRFLLQGGGEEAADEYSGVVELTPAARHVMEPKDIEAMLARNFDLTADQVQLLNWSRVH